MKLNQNIRFYREQIDMSEYTLARLIGVDVEKVRAWEKGTAKPAPGDMHFIACALNIDDGRLTDPGPLPEKKQVREEVKHDHAAFDGGVLGQPEGIYGTGKPQQEPDRARMELPKDTSVSKTAENPLKTGYIPQNEKSAAAAEQAKLHPTFASEKIKASPSEMEYVIWNGKPRASGGTSASTVFLILISVVLFLFFIGTAADGNFSAAILIVIGIFIFVAIRLSKREKRMKEILRGTDYRVSDRRVVITTAKAEVSVNYDQLRAVRIVNEQQETQRGTIIFDVLGAQKIVEVPKMSEDAPATVFYNIDDVRGVFKKINSAYNAYKKQNIQ